VNIYPLVSILIPAYNAEPWIAGTLQSSIDQTWANKEIIVVDDGSKDGTLAIARRFESTRVKVITQPNQGAATARNKALSLSQGDYIQWLDADDLLAPDKVEKQVEALVRCQSKRTLFSSAWAPFAFRPYKARFTPTPLWQNLSAVEWKIRQMQHNLHMQTGTWLTSRELADAAGPWNAELTVDDDGEYFCRVMLASDNICFVPEAKVFYRMTGPNRLSRVGFSNKKKDSQFASMRLHIESLRSLEDSDRVRAACVQYLQNWLIHFYPERPDIVREAERFATELGGSLTPPRLSWKYRWIKELFGWSTAKYAQLYYNQCKSEVTRNWDRIMFLLSHRHLPA
jgi:glycosyltransferase involved in cell wall biosynthesis